MARTAKIAHRSVGERRARGREARDRTPLSSHTGWAPAADRPDPITLLEEQDVTREPDLVPVRHGRMLVSPFAFYRGAAKVMVADLNGTPTAGLDAQLCGDAHLSNFGMFASPERRLLFDLNDFDETLPGPFEYDVKRMAASFTIAARNNGFTKADTHAATLAPVTAYREAMAGFAEMGTMDIWYAYLSDDELTDVLRSMAKASKTKKGAKAARRAEKSAQKAATKARTRDSLQALSRLGELVSGQYRIVSQPPIVVPARDLEASYCYVPQCGYRWSARIDGCVILRAEEEAAVPVLLFARPPVDPAEEHTIRRLAGARHAPGDWIRRARMIAHSWDGQRTTQIAHRLGCHPQTVRERLHRFNAEGVDGLGDRPGPGRPRRLTETDRGRIIALARSQPPGRLHQGGEGLLPPAQPVAPAHWTLDALAQAARAEGIRVGRSQVRRILISERVRWRPTRSWTTSTDPEFAPKSAGHRLLHHPAAGCDRGLRRRAGPGDPAQLPTPTRLDR